MASSARSQTPRDPLDESFVRLERMLPGPLSRALRWLHDPKSRLFRIPLGILCIVAGLLWFLPVLGLQFLPIGLLLIAQDVPFLRRPVGRLTLRLLDWARHLKQRWKARSARHGKAR